jgi:G:T/U-mismatch repair DNA glycosylase
MTVLPDYLAPGLRIVFCGTAVSTASAERGHYYAGPGNEFWSFLHRSGLTPVLLSPDRSSARLASIRRCSLSRKAGASCPGVGRTKAVASAVYRGRMDVPLSTP